MRYGWIAGVIALNLLLAGAPAAAPEPARVSRVHLIFDDAQNRVVRKTYTVWAAEPAANLEFEWLADRPSAAEAELVTGSGRLLWRDRSRTIVSVYAGAMKNGRPHGEGTLRTRDGLRYEGRWANGLYEGAGTLQQADGSSYDGAFKNGRFEGEGILVQTDGESYTGPFRAGVRHGTGKTRLPSGSSYQSEWANGVEVADSRRVRLAQGMPSPGVPLQFVPGDLKISINTAFLPKNEEIGSPGTPIGYVAANGPDIISIRPDDKALVAAWDGTGLISDDYLGLKVGWPVALDVRIKNAGTKPIDLKRSFLAVDESTSDRRPLYSLWYEENDSRCNGEALETRLVFRNHGWSNPLATRLDLNFSTDGSGPQVAAAPATVSPKPSGTIIFDLKPALKRLGVNLDKPLDCRKLSPAACLDAAAKSKAFGKLSPTLSVKRGALSSTLTGQMSYTWANAKGTKQSSTAKFRVPVVLSTYANDNTCAEGSSPPEYDPGSRTLVKPILDKANYQLPLPFKRTLAPGATATIGLVLDSGASARHRFHLAFETGDGRQISSRNVDVTVIWPKTNFFDYQMNPYEEEEQ